MFPSETLVDKIVHRSNDIRVWESQYYDAETENFLQTFEETLKLGKGLLQVVENRQLADEINIDDR